MTQSTKQLYTAAQCAAALAGRTAAWTMYTNLAAVFGIDQAAQDVRAELGRLPVPTNTKKGAGKTLANYVALLRRAETNHVALYNGDKLKAPGRVEKECKDAEGASDAAPAPEAATPTPEASEPDARDARIAELEAALAVAIAQRDAALAKLASIGEAKSLKDIKAIIAA